MATKLEHCQIHPFPATDDHHEISLPLTHFDIPFLLLYPTQRLIFFDFPNCSKPHFLETIVPGLKKSLSITIAHFLPLAGNIILPPINSAASLPVIRYRSGDSSIPLTIAQCDHDFDILTGNHQRVADEFYASVPVLPPAKKSPDGSVELPVLALQITLFPGHGICVGLTNHHASGDESSILNFVKTWAFANRFGTLMDGKHPNLPVFDRSSVQDPNNGLKSKAWDSVKKSTAVDLPPLSFPIGRVRATFILTKNEVQTLKKYVLSNMMPNICYISSFTVISAFIWTCSLKSSASTADDETVYFTCPADCRARSVPPLPAAYFGNCVVIAIAQSRAGLLKGNDGFVIAAESIGEAIRETVYGEGKEMLLDFGGFYGKKHVMGVAGSPRFDVYEVDYGWGRTKKYEFAHLDREQTISISKSREFEGGFEIGLSRTKVVMDAFEDVFNQGLQTIRASDY